MFVMGLLPTINDITMNVMKLNYLTSSLDKKIFWLILVPLVIIFILLGSAVYTQANIIKFNNEVAAGSNAFSS